MSVLDLERGTELMLSVDVEAFWLSDRLPCSAPGVFVWQRTTSVCDIQGCIAAMKIMLALLSPWCVW